ncbi:DNA glycosylase AlkZ-like family protein [Granulicoccus sp. GXG6511]|uniref:DNA glycosylase AlkZ-like family protein n=1 Tax=Granulicoccus sp. GXG6511 TaxID=3381351 RepID=UPI003D7F106A
MSPADGEMITWEELAARALARQFPAASGVRATSEDLVHALVHLMGPIQAQAARAPFVAICARDPEGVVDHAAITAAYESLAIVRGSSIRGTVHTSTAEAHPVLDSLTRSGIGSRWRQWLPFERSSPEDLWAGLERYAAEEWRTVADLRAFMFGWLTEHESADASEATLGHVGKYLAFGHGGLIRRPLKGGWEGQGAPGYRAASALLGDRSAVLADPEGAIRSAVRSHLRCHGPSSTQDIAWWAGLGLRQVGTAVESLGAELTSRTGPDGRAYHDLVHPPASGRDLPGVVLLPEFDSLLCAYDPAGRTRFIDPEHHRILFQSANGLIRPPLLVDGRITGYWRLEGSGRTRSLTAFWFPRTRRPRIAEVRAAAETVTRALPIELGEVRVTRHA